MRLFKSLGWILQVVVVSLVAFWIAYILILLDTRIQVFKPLGWVSLVVVSVLVLCGIYYEIKERCSKEKQGEHAPQEGKWFLRQAEWTFPLTFAFICVAGIIALEGIKASMG